MSPGKRKLKLRCVVANIKAKSYCNMKQHRMVLPAGCDWKEALRPDGIVLISSDSRVDAYTGYSLVEGFARMNSRTIGKAHA